MRAVVKTKKYLSLFKSFFVASAIADLEYRMNLVVKVGTDIIWYVSQIVVFEVLFNHTNQISGWTMQSTRVFMGVLFMADALYMTFVSENIERFSDKIRKGDLDMLLTKPVNAQFMVSLQRVSTAYIVNFFLAAAWFVWSLSQLPGEVAWWKISYLFILLPSGLIINYSCRFFFSAAALIFTQSENIGYVWHQFYRLGSRPDTIYPKWIRIGILTLLPVAFIVSVPTRAILGQADVIWLIISPLVAAIFLKLSNRYWKFGLTKYSSASS